MNLTINLFPGNITLFNYSIKPIYLQNIIYEFNLNAIEFKKIILKIRNGKTIDNNTTNIQNNNLKKFSDVTILLKQESLIQLLEEKMK